MQMITCPVPVKAQAAFKCLIRMLRAPFISRPTLNLSVLIILDEPSFSSIVPSQERVLLVYDSSTSTSKDNMSMVMLEMEWGTDLDEVINDVRSYIDMTKDNLPSGCSNPFIFKFSSSSMPILQYAITADESYPGLDKLLNDDVMPQLNRVDGIGNLSLSGSPERYVYVDINQEKLDAYHISLEAVGQAVSNNNLNLS